MAMQKNTVGREYELASVLLERIAAERAAPENAEPKRVSATKAKPHSRTRTAENPARR